MNELFSKPYDGSCAIGAFNVHNLEFIHAVIDAAEMERSPVTLAIAPLSIKYLGLEMLGTAALEAADRAKVPVAVHLDHARDLDVVDRALRLGFTSVMFDGSALPLEENIQKSRKMVEAARSYNATSEAEVGILSQFGVEAPSHFTDPTAAERMIAETNVDFLAVSVGTVHAMPTQGARVDLKLLSQLRSSLTIPMVLHGSSGVVEEDLGPAIRNGIGKVNIGTYLKGIFTASLQKRLNCSDPGDLFDYMPEVVADIREGVQQKLRLLGSSGVI
jgi:ketose-bisphosphate aldolase